MVAICLWAKEKTDALRSRRRKCLRLIPAIAILLVWFTSLSWAQKIDRTVANTEPAIPDAEQLSQLYRRKLKLPSLHPGERCPVSRGSREAVPHVGYIFCSECLFFGRGPAYLSSLFFDNPNADVAVMNLDKVFYRDQGAYSAKTAWVSRPDYSGPILARGRRLDGDGQLQFHFDSRGIRDLQLAPLRRADASQWSFWPTSLVVPGPGCYGIQIDTTRGTDVVILEAIKDGTEPRIRVD